MDQEKKVKILSLKSTISDDRQYRAELFRWACSCVCPGFKPYTPALINELFKYLNRESKSLDSSKGLWLFGPIGTGKTTILRICQLYQQAISFNREIWRSEDGFLIESASFIANKFAKAGNDALDMMGITGNRSVDFAFDELGREPIPVKYYGTETNVLEYILQTRYEMRRECKTHVTTNLSDKEIASVYGPYIADRVKEMFNLITVDAVNGKSLRE